MLKIIIVAIFTIIAMICIAIQLADFTRIQQVLGTVVVGIVAFALSFWMFPNFSSDSSNKLKNVDEFGNSEYTAVGVAEFEVKKLLKAPSTAKFCSQSEAEILRDGNTWSVEGWVDAENSYGAMLREKYVVKITFTGKDVYNVVYCKIKE